MTTRSTSSKADSDAAELFELVGLYVPTTAALARVLGVSTSAVQQAEARGKIEREPDGTWDVIECVLGWRHSTWSALQRPSATRLACLDPSRDFTDDDVGDLIVRTRAAGGEVLDGENDWQPLPSPAAILRAGTPLSEAAILELDATVPNGSWWYLQPPGWAPAVAARLGLTDEAAVRAALSAVIREALAELGES
jgi:hypothetical protein